MKSRDLRLTPEPLRLEPIFSPRIWGARSLAPLYPGKSDLAEPLGEVWLTGLDCRIATRAVRGKTLGEAWREMPDGVARHAIRRRRRLPSAGEVHFSRGQALHPGASGRRVCCRAREAPPAAGERPRCGTWFLRSPDAESWSGLKPGVTKETFLDGARRSTPWNLCSRRSRFMPAIRFFVPAGTPHTIGPGMVVCEVQEYSDMTYRVYDYGRVDAHGKPRELHIDKALDVIKFRRDHLPERPRRLPPPRRGTLIDRLLAACRYFAAERWEFAGPTHGEDRSGTFRPPRHA